MSETIDCRACAGHGTFLHHGPDGVAAVLCDKCEGRGVVEAERDYTYEVKYALVRRMLIRVLEKSEVPAGVAREAWNMVGLST